MASKIKRWSVSVLGGRPFAQVADSIFYTSDTKADLVIRLVDGEFNPPRATVILINQDGSVVSEEVDVVDDVLTYPLHTTEYSYIKHHGNWQLQIIYIRNGKKYTSGVMSFRVEKYLLAEEVEPIHHVQNLQLVKEMI